MADEEQVPNDVADDWMDAMEALDEETPFVDVESYDEDEEDD